MWRGVFLWQHPWVECVSLVLLVLRLFLVWVPVTSFLRECWPSPWQRVWPVLWFPESALDVRQGLLFAHSSVQGGVCFQIIEVEALKVAFSKVPLPSSACFVPKEVNAEASEHCVVIANRETMVLPKSSPRLHPFLCCIHPRSSARLVLRARVLLLVVLQPGTWWDQMPWS